MLRELYSPRFIKHEEVVTSLNNDTDGHASCRRTKLLGLYNMK